MPGQRASVRDRAGRDVDVGRCGRACSTSSRFRNSRSPSSSPASPVARKRRCGRAKVSPQFARAQVSMAIFLSGARPDDLQAELLTGYPPDTPAAVVVRVTWPDETIVRTTVGEVAAAIRSTGADRTVLVLVGDALRAAPVPARSHLYSPAHGTSFRLPSRNGSTAGRPSRRRTVVKLPCGDGSAGGHRRAARRRVVRARRRGGAARRRPARRLGPPARRPRARRTARYARRALGADRRARRVVCRAFRRRAPGSACSRPVIPASSASCGCSPPGSVTRAARRASGALVDHASRSRGSGCPGTTRSSQRATAVRSSPPRSRSHDHHKVAVLVSRDSPPEALGRAVIAAGSQPRDVWVCSRLGEAGESVTQTDLEGLAGGAVRPVVRGGVRRPGTRRRADRGHRLGS